MTDPSSADHRAVRRAEALTVLVGVSGLVILPALYVGSFAYFAADDFYGWGFIDSLDNRTRQILGTFYWPLIWLYSQVTGV